VAGVRINVRGEIQPLLDRVVAAEIAQLEARLREDARLEQAARRAWGEMCRSMRLPSAGPGSPALWLEVKPVAASAAQPRVSGEQVEMTFGLRAETRVLAEETTPQCPFPATLGIVPRQDSGAVSVALPIDLPFTELERLLAAQLVGRTFPQDGSGPARVTVRGVKLTPSGERILVALDFRAQETRFFGLSAEGTLYLWGKPALDAAEQRLRFTDIGTAVESEAAFGLFGAAMTALRPYVEQQLAERAVVDLKPFAAEARQRIEQGVAAMNARRGDAAVAIQLRELKLAEIAFDARVLRLVAEAEGSVALAVTALPVR
jgi:hypothetical protein